MSAFLIQSYQLMASNDNNNNNNSGDNSDKTKYQDWRTTLQANYDEVEGALKKQYKERLSAEQALSLTQSKLTQLEQEKQHVDTQLAAIQAEMERASQDLQKAIGEQAKLREKLTQQTQHYTTLMNKEKQRMTDQINVLKYNFGKADEQLKTKDSQLHMGARHRRQIEGQMVEAHKEKLMAQTQLAQEKGKVAQLTNVLVSVLSTVGNPTIIKYIQDNLSPSLGQTVLQGTNQRQQWQATNNNPSDLPARSQMDNRTFQAQQSFVSSAMTYPTSPIVPSTISLPSSPNTTTHNNPNTPFH
ncbi:hypothetical protein BC941DRAFT_431013 [Chlamydoabsidia padenii]|nr:hypothetical protein BC941DRAFT_431013 [Chlamydoabsidia padenii]